MRKTTKEARKALTRLKAEESTVPASRWTTGEMDGDARFPTTTWTRSEEDAETPGETRRPNSLSPTSTSMSTINVFTEEFDETRSHRNSVR
jgi:cobaltochelatase CobT